MRVRSCCAALPLPLPFACRVPARWHTAVLALRALPFRARFARVFDAGGACLRFNLFTCSSRFTPYLVLSILACCCYSLYYYCLARGDILNSTLPPLCGGAVLPLAASGSGRRRQTRTSAAITNVLVTQRRRLRPSRLPCRAASTYIFTLACLLFCAGVRWRHLYGCCVLCARVAHCRAAARAALPLQALLPRAHVLLCVIKTLTPFLLRSCWGGSFCWHRAVVFASAYRRMPLRQRARLMRRWASHVCVHSCLSPRAPRGNVRCFDARTTLPAGLRAGAPLLRCRASRFSFYAAAVAG